MNTKKKKKSEAGIKEKTSQRREKSNNAQESGNDM